MPTPKEEQKCNYIDSNGHNPFTRHYAAVTAFEYDIVPLKPETSFIISFQRLVVVFFFVVVVVVVVRRRTVLSQPSSATPTAVGLREIQHVQYGVQESGHRTEVHVAGRHRLFTRKLLSALRIRIAFPVGQRRQFSSRRVVVGVLRAPVGVAGSRSTYCVPGRGLGDSAVQLLGDVPGDAFVEYGGLPSRPVPRSRVVVVEFAVVGAWWVPRRGRWSFAWMFHCLADLTDIPRRSK